MTKTDSLLPYQSTDEWVDTKERYVVFFDIMGFKDKVARHTHQSILNELTQLSDRIVQILNDLDDPFILLKTQFSDSIVLFSKNDSFECFEAISKTAIEIMKSAIKLKIPIKGAISHGKMTVDDSKQLYFGQALIDAFLLEEDVCYYGVVAHHTVEKVIKNMPKENPLSHLFHDIKAPLKNGDISHYELTWTFNNQLQLDGEVKQWLTNIRENVSDSPRRYIDNTFRVIDLIGKKDK